MPRIKPENNSATICLIVRDEAPYILEWIAHYQSLGVQDFIIYDNKSQDKTAPLLRALAKSGVIQHFYIDEKSGVQNRAYERAVKHCKTEWIGYLDMDEFVQLDTHGSIPEFLATFDESVASVSLVWKSFGSSNRHHFSREPVTTRFTQRGTNLDFGNMWSKYFARVELLITPDIHVCVSKPGFSHLLADGSERSFFSDHQLMPNYGVASLHHYPIKSHEEGLYKTKIRGQAVGRRLDKYNENYMASHDLNDTQDLSLALRWGEVAKCLNELRKLSIARRWQNLFDECTPTTPHVLAKQKLWPLNHPSFTQQTEPSSDSNLNCLLISSEASAARAVAAVAHQLGLRVSGSAPDFLDAELQSAVTKGDWKLAANRSEQLLAIGVQFITLFVDAKIATLLKNKDLFKQLGVWPARVIGLLRDPLASGIKSMETSGRTPDANPVDALSLSLVAYQEVVRQLGITTAPRLWLSAEGLLHNTAQTIVEVSSFLGFGLNPLEFQALKYAVSDDLGLRLAWNTTINGSFDTILNGKITGWARWLDTNKPPVKLQVLVNHQIVGDAVASLYRADLESAGHGACAFEFNLPMATKPGDIISVLVKGEKYQLNNSPTVYLG